jgi:monoamine oxidase
MHDKSDIIVVGAGVSGMTAAVELARAGLRVAVLEARDRVGGRVFTKHDPVTNAPVELGAEFIHGRPPQIINRLRELKIDPISSSGEDWCEKNGQLTPCDVFSDVDALLEKMDERRADESFLDFIERCCPDASEETKDRSRRYITGFHAADPAQISVHSLVRGLRADERIDGERTYRIPGGYAVLIKDFQKELGQAAVTIHLNTIVQNVRWKPDLVVLDCHTDAGHHAYFARQVLVTLPLGVLQARPEESGAVRFLPDLPALKQKALTQLAMGKVMRVNLRFRERFWDNLRPNGSKSLADMRFLFSRQNWFPTWWTTLPVRNPMITGWAPFHCAEELSGQDPTLVLSSACETLRILFKMGEQQIEDLTDTVVYHDWETDPFSRGAYSYVKVGGDTAQADLAAPVQETVFFAGEATDISGYHGTVHGAMAAGQRAAKEMLRARNEQARTGS